MNDALINQGNQYEKFFFYPQKIFVDHPEQYKNIVEQLIDDCEKLTRQCDELKVELSLRIRSFSSFS